jgi:hydroxyethylthiazole kinase-like uncharacterized protein yjeF
MKLFTSEQIREWDKFTIQHKPISSIDLMEFASMQVSDWIDNTFTACRNIVFFCGPGNNGGDGLAVARILSFKNYAVQCYIIKSQNYSTDFQTNLIRLDGLVTPTYLEDKSEFSIPDDCIIVDAMIGHGLSRPLTGIYLKIANQLSNISNPVIAIDMPSGVFSDKSSKGDWSIHADYTLTFQTPKLAQLLPENDDFVGQLVVLDIDLSKEYIIRTHSDIHFIDEECIKTFIKARRKYAHKGIFGKALIIAGSKGSMGAAVLCSKACFRAGAGLVYALIPSCGLDIMQISLPEAIAIEYKENTGNLSNTLHWDHYSSLGIGPGISEDESSVKVLQAIFNYFQKPIVLDASALNLISMHQKLFKTIPKGSILTPHPKEFERLAGKSENDFERLKRLKELANTMQCIWILKGAHTAIALPNGEVYFNSTGNPGMATAGSGDVLTGIITGLLAQGYKPEEAAILGVYLHGYAGDKASKKTGVASLLASDIIEGIKDFYLKYES